MKRKKQVLKKNNAKLMFCIAQMQQCLDLMSKVLLEDYFRDTNVEAKND